MKYYNIVLAMVCFIYGLWLIITSKMFVKDIRGIAEKHRGLYSKLCGVALLIMSAIMGILYCLIEKDKLYSVAHQPILLSVFGVFIITPVAIILMSRKVLKNK